MIAFQGGYFNTTDPAEAVFIRSTDYFQRGMVVEQFESAAVPTGPPVPRNIPATWPVPSANLLRSTIRSSAPPPTPLVPPKRASPKHDRAVVWLKTMLRDGRPMPASWMLQQALLTRISLRTLRRARMTVRVMATKEGMTGRAWAKTLKVSTSDSIRGY